MDNHKKKALFVITKSVWGGAQRYVFDLATRLPADQFDVAVALGGNGFLCQKLKTSNIKVIYIQSFQYRINPLKEIMAFFELLGIYLMWRPHIIHTNSSKAGGLGAIAALLYQPIHLLTRGKLCKTIFTAHGWAFHEQRGKLTLFLIKTISEITVFLHHKVICVSKFDYESALKNWIGPQSKFIHIPLGINIQEIDAVLLPKEKAQQKLLGRPESRLVIGNIAEWNTNKGWRYFIDAMAKLLQEGHDYLFLMIGGGENRDEEKLRVALKEYKIEQRVILHKFVPDAALYLKAFDIFILPSLKEGFPYSLLEAAALEIPIIATSVGGIPEFIENEKTGILVPPKQWLPITEAINTLVKDASLRQLITKNARQKLETDYNIDKMVQETIKLYKK